MTRPITTPKISASGIALQCYMAESSSKIPLTKSEEYYEKGEKESCLFILEKPPLIFGLFTLNNNRSPQNKQNKSIHNNLDVLLNIPF